jgi:hypothetical protein
MGELRNAYTILMWKPEGKRPLGRPRRRWLESIKIDLKRDRMGWCGLDRSGSAQGPMDSSCEQGNQPFIYRRYLYYIASNSKMIEGWIGKDLEGSHCLIDLLSRNFLGGTEETHENPQSG